MTQEERDKIGKIEMELMGLDLILETLKKDASSPALARHFAVARTEVEKLRAYWIVYLVGRA